MRRPSTDRDEVEPSVEKGLFFVEQTAIQWWKKKSVRPVTRGRCFCFPKKAKSSKVCQTTVQDLRCEFPAGGVNHQTAVTDILVVDFVHLLNRIEESDDEGGAE